MLVTRANTRSWITRKTGETHSWYDYHSTPNYLINVIWTRLPVIYCGSMANDNFFSYRPSNTSIFGIYLYIPPDCVCPLPWAFNVQRRLAVSPRREPGTRFPRRDADSSAHGDQSSRTMRVFRRYLLQNNCAIKQVTAPPWLQVILHWCE